jgi:hypothetical protein
MARVGVLSDLAVKYRNPEWFPLDIGHQGDMHPVHLQKNIFRGIKVPKRTKRYTSVSRFPVNDLKNFAQFGATDRHEEAEFYAIQNYRRELGSNNVMPHLESAYQRRIKADYIPPPEFRPDPNAGGVQVGPTLSLGRLPRREASNVYSRTIPGSRSYLSTKIRATMANLVDESELEDLTRIVAPETLARRLHDDEVLSRLTNQYRDDPQALSHIERSYHQAGRQDILPIEPYEPFQEE